MKSASPDPRRAGWRSPIAVDDCIRAAERTHDLLALRVDGWAAWAIVRLAVQIESAYDLHAAACRLNRLAEVREVFRDLPAWLVSPRASTVIKTYASGLLEEDHGRFKDVWFDDLVMALPAPMTIRGMNNPAFGERRRRAMFPAAMGTAFIDAYTSLLRRRRSTPEIRHASQEIGRVAQREIAPSITPEWVEARLRYFSASRRVYHQLLRRVRPTHVLVADPGEYSLVAAAKELGVAVFEMQHGFFDRCHSGYSWTDYALRYRDRLPVADRLLTFGDYWCNELKARGFWGDSARSVGSAHIERYQNARRQSASDRRVVLFTAQGIDVAGAVDVLRAFLELMPGDGVRLIVRLHPIYDTDRMLYDDAFCSDPRVTVLSATEGGTTLDLLKSADIHMSISSTCHYDAIALGVPTVILPLESSELMQPLADAGHAIMLGCAEDLASIVASPLLRRLPEEVIEHYYRPNAVKNMRGEMRC